MTDKQIQFLRGLLHNHAYASASERGDPEIQWLIDHGFVETWSTVGGFTAWQLTDEGRTRAKDYV